MTHIDNDKPSASITDFFIPGFDIRRIDTWREPSLIVRLKTVQQDELHDTFKLNLKDLDVYYRTVLECYDTGTARDTRMKREKNLKVVLELNKKEDGIQIVTYFVALTTLEGEAYPRKVSFVWLLPAKSVGDYFDRAHALTWGMVARKVTLQAQQSGDRGLFEEICTALQGFEARLNGAHLGTVKDAVETKVAEQKKEGNPKNGGRKGNRDRGGREKVDKVDAAAGATARELVMAATGIDPDAPEAPETEEASFAEVMTPVPVASASPTPAAPKQPKKEKPKAIKLGSPEATAELVKLGATAPSTGSNGQT